MADAVELAGASALPPIAVVTPPMMPLRLSRLGRMWSALIAIGCAGVLIAAAYLAPDPAGVGTTTRLGMAPCGFLEKTGLPCAACGMTTSFNYAVRWNWAAAFWAQPMGLVLTLATAATFWGSAYTAFTGVPIHRLLSRLPGVKLIVAFFALGIAAWAFKMVLTLTGNAAIL
ncbi:MAG: DUF2752 domain-containing protein [Planctomycetota bacterium]